MNLNLMSLKRRIRELATFIKYGRSFISEKENYVKTSNIKDVVVKGSSKKADISDVVAEIVEMINDVEKAEQEYDRLIKLTNELEEGYKELKDRDKQIYVDYYIKGYSAIKIGMIYGITDRQVRRIVKKVDKEIIKEEKKQKNN